MLYNRSFYPWVVIGMCASLLFYKYILTVSPSIMSHELMHQFHINGLQLGNLAAIFFYVYTLVQICAGLLLDKYGVRWLVGFSILAAALGAWLFSQSQSLMLAAFSRGLMGYGIGFATVVYLKMAAVWFKPQQNAFVSGLLATAVMAGALFGQAPMAALLEQTSWRFVLEFTAVLGLIIALLFIFLVREKPEKSNSQQEFSWDLVLSVLKNKQNWLLTFYSGLAFAPLSVLGGLWGNPFTQEAYHVSRTEAAVLLSMMFIGLGVGSPFFGLCSDRLGKRVPVMKAGLVLSLISLLLVLYMTKMPIGLLGLCLFLLGFGVGAFMLGFVLGARINCIALAATVVALINTGDNIFESLTEPFIGKLLDVSWQGQIIDGVHYFSVQAYQWAFLALPFYFVIALILLFFIKEPEDS